MTLENLQEILANASIEDLPYGDARLIGEAIGIEKAAELIYRLGGCTLYLQKSAFDSIIKQYILENAKKFSSKELVMKTGKSEVYIYGVLKSQNIQA